LLDYPVPTNKFVADAYLAAFAIAASMRLTTFDSGFEQFRGLELQLLAT
jgi:predicted nucleic acid-binding protein